MTGPSGADPFGSGYLHRLAARAAGADAGARPRVPSRFEVAAGSEEPLDAPATTSPRTLARADRPPVVGRHVSQGRSAAPATVSEPNAHHPDPEPTAQHDVVRAPAAPELSGRDFAAGPVAGSAATAPQTREREAAAPLVELVRPATPVATAAPQMRSPSAAPVPATPVVPRRPEPPREGARPEERSAPPDVVVVSVGRVDVRAVPPPAPAPAPRPAASAAPPAERMSLHDYLRGEREAR